MKNKEYYVTNIQNMINVINKCNARIKTICCEVYLERCAF
jgi:hypothetical protein